MATEGLLELCKINLAKLKNKEISPEDFYEIYQEHLLDHEREIERLSRSNENYRLGVEYLKEELRKIKTNISDIESNYSNLFNQ